MSTIAEFISGTVNESLKKFLQPVGLIPAAIFVLLNLAFVYPAARADGVPLATAFAKLDAPTQAAILGLVALALGYFLLSASSTILDIVGGQLIRGSVLYALLVWIQRRRRAYLLRDDAPNRWYSSKRFYLPTEGEPPEPLPSALGNVLVATQGTLERRYRLDMAALWSQLVASPELKELPARAVVEDERAARDTLVNTAFVLWLFAVEGLVFFTFQNEPKHALLALIAVPVGFVVYRFAVAKGHAWGSAVETLVDLHRDKLHAALKLAKYGSLREERQVWERAGRFYVSAGEEVSGDDVFEREDAPSVTAIPAGDLTIPDPVSAVVEGRPPASHPDWLRWIEYVVLVSKRRAAAPATNAEILVDDPRVAWIEPFQPAEGSPGQPKVVRGSGNQRLLWSLAALAPGAAVSLQYELPLFTLQAQADGEWNSVQSELVRGVGFSVAVPDDVVCLRVKRFASGDGRPELWVEQTRRRPTSSDGRTYEWEVTPGQFVWIVLPDQP
jgi:hypothetical protein